MQPITKMRKAFREIPTEIRRLAARQYPSFVLERVPAPRTDRVPVFVLHTVEERQFTKQLEFLRSNGYRTLTVREFLSYLAGEHRPTEPSVLLTLDDGDRSWYDVAYPLLQRYGYSAVGFVVPRRVRETPGPRGERGWLSWREIEEIERSGVIDFQSHGHYHDRIFVGPELVDFYSPDYPVDTLELATPWTVRGGVYTNELPYGTPLYRSAPSMQGHLRYIEDGRLSDECVRFTQANGGREFFRAPGWRRKLKNFYFGLAVDGSQVRYETPAERRERLLASLVESKRLLEERLQKPVEHFCYPWGAGSELAVTLAKEAGYRSSFWTSLPARTDNAAGDSPFYVPRIKDDYIMRLPGAGRVPLRSLLAEKAMRRARKADIY